MKIFLIHNYYQHPGGEDEVFMDELSMLEQNGHRIVCYTIHNDRIKKMNSLRLAFSTIWNMSIAGELRKIIKNVRPDLVHFHNTFPLISPSAYYAAKAENVPVVQTLHNYRLFCPSALLFNNGRVCEKCLTKFIPWPSVLHACYRKSLAATSVTAWMLSIHHALHTFKRKVDVYIVMSEIVRKNLIYSGISKEKIAVKPNFVNHDSGMGKEQGGYALFVGRLSQEKGIDTLLSSWEIVGNKLTLKIAGEGPLALKVTRGAQNNEVVEFLGRQTKTEVFRLMKYATVLIFPSIWYECFPLTMIEAFSVGLPVIASNLGSMSSLVEHGRTGLHFSPGDPKDLAEKVNWAINNPEKIKQMRLEARKEYERKYTAEINYKMLMDIYKAAIRHSKEKS